MSSADVSDNNEAARYFSVTQVPRLKKSKVQDPLPVDDVMCHVMLCYVIMTDCLKHKNVEMEVCRYISMHPV